ncbi:MAG: DMT family transporter [Kiritimatiellales bacterium]|nr:DMT family transporter [Kiritimatiellales bacterium]
MELTIALSSGILTMLFWGFADFFAKITIEKINALTALMYVQIIGFIIMSIFILTKEVTFAEQNYTTLLLVSAIEVAGYYFFYRSIKIGNVSIVSPIVASYAGGATLISLLFFGEVLDGNIIIILSFIIVGIILSSYKTSGEKYFHKGVKEAVLSMACFSIWFPLWDSYVSAHGWMESLYILRLFMSLLLILSICITRTSIKISKRNFVCFGLIGALDLLAYVSLGFGYANTGFTSLISVLSAIFPIIVIVLAYFFLRERLNKIQILGISLILISIGMLSIV